MRPSPGCLLASVALLLALCACGGDGGSQGDGPPPRTSPGTPTAGGSPSPSTTRSSSTSATVTPASGPELRGTISSLRVPRGWRVGRADASFQYVAHAPLVGGDIYLEDMDSPGGLSLDRQYQLDVATLASDVKLTRLPNVRLGGETTAFHFRYTEPGSPTRTDEIGADRDGRSITVTIGVVHRTLAKDPDLVEEVLASFQWMSSTLP